MPETEFDLAAFNESWEAENAESTGVDIFDEVDEPELEEESEFEEVETEEVEETVVDVVPDLSEEQKRNASFAQLRRERDEAAQQTAWIQQMAEENGMSVEDLKNRYEESKLVQQSESEGVPVEVLQRLQSLENENKTIKEQTYTERFNAEVKALVEAHNLQPADLDRTFAFAVQKGLVDSVKEGKTSVEDIYFLAHRDQILEIQGKKAVQESLAKKKKRQTEAQIPAGSGSGVLDVSLEDRAIADATRLIAEGNF